MAEAEQATREGVHPPGTGRGTAVLWRRLQVRDPRLRQALAEQICRLRGEWEHHRTAERTPQQRTYLRGMYLGLINGYRHAFEVAEFALRKKKRMGAGQG